MRTLAMNSTFKSFNISIIFHALLIGVISYFISKPNIKEIEYGKNMIMLTSIMGSGGGSKTKSVSAPSVKPLKATSSNSIATKTITTSASTSASASSIESSGTGTSSGNGQGTGTGEGSGFDFNGSIVNYSEPVYPRMAIVRGIEGSLKVKIKVDSEGNAIETTLLKSSGSELLDSAAMAAIKKWQFVKRDIKTFYFVEKTIVFQIKK